MSSLVFDVFLVSRQRTEAHAIQVLALVGVGHADSWWLRVRNWQRQISLGFVVGQRHHSYQASVRSGVGFGVSPGAAADGERVAHDRRPADDRLRRDGDRTSGLLGHRGAPAEGERDRNGHAGRPGPAPLVLINDTT